MRATATTMPEPPPSPPATDAAADQQTTIRVPLDIRSAALTIIAALGLILVLQYAQAMLIPIVLSILISYALDPLVTRLERLRVPRPLAAGVLLMALVAASA